MTIQARLLKAHDEGRLVHCKWPGSGNMAISLERHMVDNAMATWQTLDEAERANAMQSVRRALKRATKKIHQGRAKPKEMDDFAGDVALFIAHDLVYGAGETYLAKGPDRAILEAGETS